VFSIAPLAVSAASIKLSANLKHWHQEDQKMKRSRRHGYGVRLIENNNESVSLDILDNRIRHRNKTEVAS